MSDDKQDLRDAFEKVMDDKLSVALLRAMADKANAPIDRIVTHDIFVRAIDTIGDKTVGKIIRELEKEEANEPKP